jgi:molybdate transport system ATP-binding protein
MDGIRARLRIARGDFQLDVDVHLPQHGISALFGPSGSGKTTCLRAIAGLERAPGGYVALGDEVWQDDGAGIFVPVHRRALGYVFQEASLFPHLSVRGNLEFGRKRVPASERRFDLAPVAELLGITGLLDRRPDGLSGGERQRVAIARALLAAPRLLLMDEPLAALDLRRKQEILPYLERMHDELAIPIIYVSHAPDEVARLADYLVLLDDGKSVASGALGETLARVDLPPAFADDAGVVLETVLAGHEPDALSRLAFDGGVPHPCARRQPGAGAAARQQHCQFAASHGHGARSHRPAGPRAGAIADRGVAAAGAHHRTVAPRTEHCPGRAAVGADQGRGAAELIWSVNSGSEHYLSLIRGQSTFFTTGLHHFSVNSFMNFPGT